jgi:hypothetical protein
MVDKLVAFSNKTDARDKFCKILQYGSRMLKALISDPKLIERLNGLFMASRDARKIFRLGKFFHEYQTIMKTISDIGIDMTEMILQVLTRSSFFVYWIFDNLQCLSSMKFLKFDPVPLGKKSNTAWFVAVVLSLISVLRNLSLNYAKEAKIKHSADPSLQTTKQSLDTLGKKRKELLTNLVKNLGDLIPSAAFAEVPNKLFNKKIPEAWIGFGGLVAGSIAAYQNWP